MKRGSVDDKALGDAVRKITREVVTPPMGELELHLDERLDQILDQQAQILAIQQQAAEERKALGDRLLAIESLLAGRESRAVGGGRKAES